MGVLSDFVIADTGQGPEIGNSEFPPHTWPTLEAKGMDPIKLATLYCSIVGKAYHNDIQASFELVGGKKNEGPWVFEFPREILHAIAGVSEVHVQDIAAKWVDTGDLQMDGWAIEDAVNCIRVLSAHANKAVQSAKSMYLWISL